MLRGGAPKRDRSSDGARVSSRCAPAPETGKAAGGSGPGFDRRRFIQDNLPLAPVPSVPELLLHQARPASGLWRLANLDPSGLGSPYWAYVWAGGLALARYILDRPGSVAGRHVLDLGTGSGIVAIAAVKAGASRVVAADIDPYAVLATGLNAAANRVAMSTVLEDLTTGPPSAANLITVGDLFYDRALACRVTAFLDRCGETGAEILIGDPGRAFLPRSRLELLAEYPVEDVGDTKGEARTTAVVFSWLR